MISIKKPTPKSDRTITRQDYKELCLYAERLGDRGMVDAAMKFYKVRIDRKSNTDAVQLIHGYINS